MPRFTIASLLLLGLASVTRADETPPPIRPPAPTPTEEELAQADRELDELELVEPNSCRQTCSSRICSPTLLSPYFFPRADMRITSATYTRLRAIRPAMLQRIGERLLPAIRGSVEIERDIVVDGEHYIAMHHEHMLAILIDMNAVEALPLLLDALVEAYRMNMPLAGLQVLSTITGILRQEGYGPLLESDLERQYGEGLAAHWTKCEKEKSPEFTWAREHGTLDPVHGIPRTHRRPVLLIELTPVLREQIETWARNFLATTPVEEHKGANAMLPTPVTR